MTFFLWIVVLLSIAAIAGQWVVLGFAYLESDETCREWESECIAGRRVQQTRDSAIRDLERLLDCGKWHALLRRAGSAAPLFGVVLSAFAVMFEGGAIVSLLREELGSADAVVRGDEITARVVTLSAGVCAGATIALLNHLFMWMLQRREATALKQALSTVTDARFRDSEDRLDHVVGQLRVGGEVLQQATGQLGDMLALARDAMAGMSESCNEAATDLKSISLNLRDAIQVPTADFVAAAGLVRDSVRDAGERLSTGLDMLNRSLGDSALSMTRSTASMRDELASGVAAVTQGLHESSTALERSVNKHAEIGKRLEASLASLEQAAEAISSRTSRLSVDDFAQLSLSCRAAADAIHSAAADFQRIPGNSAAVQEALAGVSKRLAEVDFALSVTAGSQKEAKSVLGELAQAARDANAAIRHLPLSQVAEELSKFREAAGTKRGWLGGRFGSA